MSAKPRDTTSCRRWTSRRRSRRGRHKACRQVPILRSPTLVTYVTWHLHGHVTRNPQFLLYLPMWLINRGRCRPSPSPATWTTRTTRRRWSSWPRWATASPKRRSSSCWNASPSSTIVQPWYANIELVHFMTPHTQFLEISVPLIQDLIWEENWICLAWWEL